MRACIFLAFLLLGSSVLAQDWPGVPLAPYAEVLDLEEAEVYLLGYAYDAQPDVLLPYGTDTMSDPVSNASITPGVRQGNALVCYMHCPYQNGHGVSFQDFAVALPEAARITLDGNTALRPGAEDSDGVTYRVLVNGVAAFAEHRKSFLPEPFQVDLTPHAGKTVRLRFEVHPGPENNTNFDWAVWSGRRIVVPGFEADPVPMPAPPALDLSRLSSRQNGSWVPLSGFEGTCSVTEVPGGFVFRYEGDDGTLAYAWQPPMSADDPLLGVWRLKATMRGGAAVEVPLMTGARITWAHEVRMTAWQQGLKDGRPYADVTLDAAGERATLSIRPKLVEKSLVLDIACDTPCIAQFYPGKWGPSPRRVQVPVPYYGHTVDYLPRENLFVSRFLDFSASNARDLIQNTATYPERIGGGRNALRERCIFTAAWHLAETFANIPNPPSPWRAALGERIVLDIWGGQYQDIATTLGAYAAHGMDGIAAIIHNWQFHGYDNGLPTHYPANPRFGGHDAMRDLAQTARAAGYYFALHENYVDYYPNYEHFNEDHIALDEKGQRIKAWFNAGTGIQSFAIRPSAMLDLARTQSPVIHENYDTNAMFHDVASCVEPWFHTDHRADGPDAATMRPTLAAHTALWEFERATHDGPVLGEGNRHWIWSGLLDGVEAQFGTGWPVNGGLDAPLNAGFNLLRIHPLQLNHGQGYFSRWYDEAPWGNILPPVLLDKYRMQEIVFGHAGFLNANWNRPHEAWLEHELTIPVSSRHATAQVENIEYLVDHKWVDLTAAAKAQDFRIVKIGYDSGMTIFANNTAEPYRDVQVELPPYGWWAADPFLYAGTFLIGGQVADMLLSPDLIFANARPASVWQPEPAPLPIRPEVVSFTPRGPRQFDVTYAWHAEVAPEIDATVFVHFCDRARHTNRPAAIRFQADHAPTVPTTQWQPGTPMLDGPWTVTLPADLPDGRYLWETGLLAENGRRLPLDGFHDGSEQIRLGYLVVSNGGKTLRHEPNGDLPPRSYWQTQHINLEDKVLDFGPLRTNGSARLERRSGRWTLRPMPTETPFTLEIRAQNIPMPETIMSNTGAMLKPTSSGDSWTFPLGNATEFKWSAMTDTDPRI